MRPDKIWLGCSEWDAQEGEVRVLRKDGQTFVIRPEKKTGSPLVGKGVDWGITTAEIVQIIRESQRAK